jgi:hypothetical protein
MKILRSVPALLVILKKCKLANTVDYLISQYAEVEGGDHSNYITLAPVRFTVSVSASKSHLHHE